MVNKEDILNALKKVADPHMGISIVDMGLIKDIQIDNDKVKVIITPTNPVCPSIINIAMQAKEVIKNVDGVKEVSVKVEGHIMEEEINKML